MLKIVKFDLICIMVAMVSDKSLLSVNGFSIAYSDKSIRPTVIISPHLSTGMANLYNYIIWMTQYLYYDFYEQTYHVSIFCLMSLIC